MCITSLHLITNYFSFVGDVNIMKKLPLVFFFLLSILFNLPSLNCFYKFFLGLNVYFMVKLLHKLQIQTI